MKNVNLKMRPASKEENMAEEKDKKEYLTEEEAKSIRGMFKKFLKSYKEKPLR